jgi:hypothetical protein
VKDSFILVSGNHRCMLYEVLFFTVNLVSSLVKVYAYPVAVSGLTFDRVVDSGNHRLSGKSDYMYNAEGL